MATVEQLENAVLKMIARLDDLKGENERLLNEIAVLSNEKNMLENENRALQSSLLGQEALRSAAVNRIDGLLRKLQNYAKVNQVIL